MSKMKSTLAATFLTLILIVPALAGQIGTPGIPPPPPPAEQGQIGTPGCAINLYLALLSLVI
ncbi:MAG: hypothetical protein H0U18_08160 [Pyrinomonadaceae bacterium]|nr:hypothetical protein [Pyrinomonadaceae bacterium]